MKTFLKSGIMILVPLFFGSNCSPQDKSGGTGLIDRQPAVAGQFYPASPQELRAELSTLFSEAAPGGKSDVLAVICPHAGYVFSGEVAASSYNQIDPNAKFDNIFILASSHRMSFQGASIYDEGDYITPLGRVRVNRELGKKLVQENPVFNDKMEPHQGEHSVEVQLPFLQYHLKNDFQIVPIVIGSQDAATCEKIGKALKPYLKEGNLFIISSDFSHYPDYDDAEKVDHITADAILHNSPDFLLKSLQDNEEEGYSNLVTSLCGWTSVLSLVYMTTDRTDVKFRLVEYKNSGDSKIYGEKDRVVGYCSIVLDQQKQTGDAGYSLTDQEKKELLNIARSTITEYVNYEKVPEFDVSKMPEKLRQPCGAFVTFKEDGQLRGCIGRFDATEPLWKVVREMAIAAATQDYRFPTVKPDEIDKIDIEISVLTPMKKISSIDEIVLGRDGIYIKKGYSSGTFLPQVATETGWTKEEFLGHCARDKAHIGWDGWKDADIYIYQAYVFGENELE